ncbi:MAG: VOC family protein, partial [Candidatus Sulfotelmatobacter sp.]
MPATASGIGITHLGQIAINAKDVERAAAFYQDVLGLRLLFKAPPGLAFFDCGGMRGGAYSAAKAGLTGLTSH